MITSGGGFSTYYTAPSFQESMIKNYFIEVTNADQVPYHGYGSGRGYPDISIAGSLYMTTIGKRIYLISGTSASTPTLAGMFSTINAARHNVGKGSLGWINPLLYMNATSFIRDITAGNNLCPSEESCCSQGFYATTGWDPATGLGSVDFGNLQTLLVSLGEVNGAASAPVLEPTPAPTVIPTSSRPTMIPTLIPTLAPTLIPTVKPTLIPTLAPTLVPTVIPTYKPSTEHVEMQTMKPTAEPTDAFSVIPTLLTTYDSVPVPTTTVDLEVLPTALPVGTPTLDPTVLFKTSTSYPAMVLTTYPTTLQLIDSPTITTDPEPDSDVIPTPSPSRTHQPSNNPSMITTSLPTISPTIAATNVPSTLSPTASAGIGITKPISDLSSDLPTVSPTRTLPSVLTSHPTVIATGVYPLIPSPNGFSVSPSSMPPKAPLSTELPSVSSKTGSPARAPLTTSPTQVPTKIPSRNPTVTISSIPSYETTSHSDGISTPAPTIGLKSIIKVFQVFPSDF